MVSAMEGVREGSTGDVGSQPSFAPDGDSDGLFKSDVTLGNGEKGPRRGDGLVFRSLDFLDVSSGL